MIHWLRRTRISTACWRCRLCAMTLAALSLGLGIAHAEDSLGSALTGGKVSLDLRYRIEHVGEANANKDANASTLRTALGYTTGTYRDFGAMVEFENISVIGPELYNSTVNGLNQYSKVQDPKGSEVNQAYLNFGGLSDTALRLGRQRITLDDQRFVGNSASRQNEQTFDGFEAVNKSVADTQITYAYLTDAHRSTGSDASNGNLRMKSHLINAGYTGLGLGTLTGYAYLLDIDNQALLGAASASTKTLGLRFTGTHRLTGRTALLYTAEYAKQNNYADNPHHYDVTYLLGELGATIAGISAKYGYEDLGSDGTYSVQVPIGTRHSRDGWDDMFSPATPAKGLVDQYLSVTDTVAGIDVSAAYHDFAADQGSARYGAERDLMASRTWEKRYTLALKYAAYQAHTYGVDTDKAWIWGEVKF